MQVKSNKYLIHISHNCDLNRTSEQSEFEINLIAGFLEIPAQVRVSVVDLHI